MNTTTTHGYENAPSTLLVATNCACCGRPLVDAKSVETGVGPECRRRHGFDTAEGEPDFEAAARAYGEALPAGADAREVANKLVHRVAVDQTGPAVARSVAAIAALGYAKLARRIAERLGGIEVEVEGDTLVVRTPKGLDGNGFAAFQAAMRSVPGARFDWTRKARIVPMASRRALWEAFKRALPSGALVIGAKVAAV